MRDGCTEYLLPLGHSDFHDIAGEYSSSASSIDKNTDRGDGQVTRIFVLKVTLCLSLEEQLLVSSKCTPARVQEVTERADPRTKKRDELVIPTGYGRPLCVKVAES